MKKISIHTEVKPIEDVVAFINDASFLPDPSNPAVYRVPIFDAITLPKLSHDAWGKQQYSYESKCLKDALFGDLTRWLSNPDTYDEIDSEWLYENFTNVPGAVKSTYDCIFQELVPDSRSRSDVLSSPNFLSGFMLNFRSHPVLPKRSPQILPLRVSLWRRLADPASAKWHDPAAVSKPWDVEDGHIIGNTDLDKVLSLLTQTDPESKFEVRATSPSAWFVLLCKYFRKEWMGLAQMLKDRITQLYLQTVL